MKVDEVRRAAMRPVKSEFRTDDGFVISLSKGAIMNSEREKTFSAGLSLPHLPDMTFADNRLEIAHVTSPSSIIFEPKQALLSVNDHEDVIKVALAKEWQASRQNCPHISKVVHPYDWTFTPDNYCGHVDKWEEVDTDENIDYDKLREREPILFFEEIILYEDELDDNGCSLLSVKVRAMRSGFFLLLRFFLRVDKTLVRVHETRLYHATGTQSIIKERCIKEATINELGVADEVLKDPNEVSQMLPTKIHKVTKLVMNGN